jgi:hypothetical protein
MATEIKKRDGNEKELKDREKIEERRRRRGQRGGDL